MAQKHIPARVDVKLIDQVREVADKQNWTFAAAMEIAMKRFVSTYQQLDLPNIGVEDTPRAITINGVTYTQQEIAEAA